MKATVVQAANMTKYDVEDYDDDDEDDDVNDDVYDDDDALAQHCSGLARGCLKLLGAARGYIVRNNDYTMINNSSASLHDKQ